MKSQQVSNKLHTLRCLVTMLTVVIGLLGSIFKHFVFVFLLLTVRTHRQDFHPEKPHLDYLRSQSKPINHHIQVSRVIHSNYNPSVSNCLNPLVIPFFTCHTPRSNHVPISKHKLTERERLRAAFLTVNGTVCAFF